MTLKQQLDQIWETGYCLNPLEKTQWGFVRAFKDGHLYITCKNLYERYCRFWHRKEHWGHIENDEYFCKQCFEIRTGK